MTPAALLLFCAVALAVAVQNTPKDAGTGCDVRAWLGRSAWHLTLAVTWPRPGYDIVDEYVTGPADASNSRERLLEVMRNPRIQVGSVAMLCVLCTRSKWCAA